MEVSARNPSLADLAAAARGAGVAHPEAGAQGRARFAPGNGNSARCPRREMDARSQHGPRLSRPSLLIGLLNRRPRLPARRRALPAWKRTHDLVLIALFLPLLLPLAGLTAVWVKALGGKGRVLFRQERVGYRGQNFTIYKFRSMKENSSTQVHQNHVRKLMSSDQPLTKLDELGDDRLIPGASVLRKLGLDELPQLIGVLRGEMSLVGPRPCLPEEHEFFSEEQRERFEAVPGLTGYWQVNGKNGTTFTEMIALDVFYARNKSLWMDLGVVARTPLAVGRQLFQRNGGARSSRRQQLPR